MDKSKFNTFVWGKSENYAYLCGINHPKMKKIFHLLLIVSIAAVLLGFLACGQVSDADRRWVDSVNVAAYKMKYHSLTEARRNVEQVMARNGDGHYRDGFHEALLNKGDIYGMWMAYDSAQWCYRTVLEESRNELMRSIADVDMMSVCLMTGMSKEFYDYRSDAQERFAMLEEESEDMTEHQLLLWKAVRTEYHFVSVNYFMKMRQDEAVREEMEWLNGNQDLFASDTTQLSVYLLLKAMFCMKDGYTEGAVDEMQRTLIRLLAMSRRSGYVYFEASALNRLARSVLAGEELKPSRRVYVEELLGATGEGNLAGKMTQEALRLSEGYGNAFLETMVLLTLSDGYLQAGRDSLALSQMEKALGLINRHHRQVNTESADVLYVCGDMEERASAQDDEHGAESFSTEMKWIADPSVITVPEWMASVREQLSVVFGAMGRKAESDYNHNIYFDILDATRQDLRVQQEEEHLKREERMLNVLLWGLVAAILALGWMLIIYNKRSRREYYKKVDMLSQVVEVCKRLPSALSEDLEDEDALDEALHGVADKEVERLFPQLRGQDWTVADDAPLKGLDWELFRVLLVFYRWLRQKGMQFISFQQEKHQLESDTYVFEKRLEENKRQYVEKLTSMSIVNGITPFLDRALREVQKLKVEPQDAMANERLLYVGELIDKINDYNEVLGHWVKIRQGIINLNIESFALQPLFDTLKRGAKAFDIKGVSLQVEDTAEVVKADKSLTLFMMNTLLDNARKYTPKNGRVRLSAEGTERYVEISVQDTGYGMSAEDVDVLNNSKVYDSSKIGSTGIHSSDIRENKGFGFGLMNCKGIIGKYKKTNQLFSVCEFGVESELGKGCRFFFRLPKGVLKGLAVALMLLVLPVQVWASTMKSPEAYADSIFVANVEGRYEEAVLYADSAIQGLNLLYQKAHPNGRQLMLLEGAGMGELEWWGSGYQMDYELIIRIRNEVAIAALALNQNALYHYNSEVFTRLYQLTSTDPALEEYCNSVKMANRNKKTIVIMLGMLMLLVLASYLLMYYRHHQLFMFNLRQFIQLNNNVFTSTEATFLSVFRQSLSDIKPVDAVGMMRQKSGEESPTFHFVGEEEECSAHEVLMRSAYLRKEEVQSGNGQFHAYPLGVPNGGNEPLTGVLGVGFCDGKLSKEEKLIMELVAQFVSIHSYFSYLKVDEMKELIELKQDERRRIAAEQQKVYVRNQIMDNSLSALKHETMYYPNRIKQMVDAALNAPEGLKDTQVVNDIDELLSYYKDIFTILSTCASKQVEKVLFKRTLLSAQSIGEMAQQSFRKQGKKIATSASFKMLSDRELYVQGDQIYIQALIDNVVSLFFEHHSEGDLLFDVGPSDGFATFAFTDTSYQYREEEIPLLFHVDHIRYDARTDTLTGAQYLICRQIIREHDAFSSRRGCRVYVENTADGQGSRFVFTLPLPSSEHLSKQI